MGVCLKCMSDADCFAKGDLFKLVCTNKDCGNVIESLPVPSSEIMVVDNGNKGRWVVGMLGDKE